jgi:hypothetical protein
MPPTLNSPGDIGMTTGPFAPNGGACHLWSKVVGISQLREELKTSWERFHDPVESPT